MLYNVLLYNAALLLLTYCLSNHIWPLHSFLCLHRIWFMDCRK